MEKSKRPTRSACYGWLWINSSDVHDLSVRCHRPRRSFCGFRGHESQPPEAPAPRGCQLGRTAIHKVHPPSVSSRSARSSTYSPHCDSRRRVSAVSPLRACTGRRDDKEFRRPKASSPLTQGEGTGVFKLKQPTLLRVGRRVRRRSGTQRTRWSNCSSSRETSARSFPSAPRFSLMVLIACMTVVWSRPPK